MLNSKADRVFDRSFESFPERERDITVHRSSVSQLLAEFAALDIAARWRLWHVGGLSSARVLENRERAPREGAGSGMRGRVLVLDAGRESLCLGRVRQRVAFGDRGR